MDEYRSGRASSELGDSEDYEDAHSNDEDYDDDGSTEFTSQIQDSELVRPNASKR